MSTFTLTWDNSSVLANSNAIGQRVSFRPKLTGGEWITIGFTPDNDLATSVNSVVSDDLPDNVIYEFKVETLCTANGPTINDNGVIEMIAFDCITPDVSATETTASINISTGMDITKARLTLRKASDNSIVSGPTDIDNEGTGIIHTVEGLTPGTNYYWQVELFTILNNIEVISSSSTFMGSVCSPYPITTPDLPSCDPVTSMDVSSIEIP